MLFERQFCIFFFLFLVWCSGLEIPLLSLLLYLAHYLIHACSSIPLKQNAKNKRTKTKKKINKKEQKKLHFLKKFLKRRLFFKISSVFTMLTKPFQEKKRQTRTAHSFFKRKRKLASHKNFPLRKKKNSITSFLVDQNFPFSKIKSKKS